MAEPTNSDATTLGVLGGPPNLKFSNSAGSCSAPAESSWISRACPEGRWSLSIVNTRLATQTPCSSTRRSVHCSARGCAQQSSSCCQDSSEPRTSDVFNSAQAQGACQGLSAASKETEVQQHPAAATKCAANYCRAHTHAISWGWPATKIGSLAQALRHLAQTHGSDAPLTSGTAPSWQGQCPG